MQKATSSNQLATKTDLKRFATKKDLISVKKSLWGEILKVEGKVENLEDDMKDVKVGQKEIMAKLEKMDNTLISFVGRVDTLETENEIGSDQIKRLEERVTTLEPTA